MTFQPALKEVYVDTFRQDILARAERDNLTHQRAFIDIVLDYLGYEDDADFRAESISDGSGDFGVDAWFISDEAATVFQFKASDDLDAADFSRSVAPSALTDLKRIYALLKSPERPPVEANVRVRNFLQKFRSVINRRASDESKKDKTYRVLINFVALGASFTAQAQDELRHTRADSSFDLNGVRVDVQYRSLFVDDLLTVRWQ